MKPPSDTPTPEPIRERIKIILCNTTHPGNIGAVARAMKTMGLGRLLLVSPREFPCAAATARAAGADDILADCLVYPSLAEAIADTRLVAATTARTRSIRWPEETPDSAAKILVEKARQRQDVAIVFGREQSGLSNEQLDLCNFMIRIPANPDFSSLNIAAAAQIVCYELHRCLGGADMQGAEGGAEGGVEGGMEEKETRQTVASDNLERFYRHLEETLIQIQYLDPDNPGKIMRRLRRVFNRTEMDEEEYHILMGILTAVKRRVPPEGGGGHQEV